jgi:hypothetical protein
MVIFQAFLIWLRTGPKELASTESIEMTNISRLNGSIHALFFVSSAVPSGGGIVLPVD